MAAKKVNTEVSTVEVETVPVEGTVTKVKKTAKTKKQAEELVEEKEDGAIKKLWNKAKSSKVVKIAGVAVLTTLAYGLGKHNGETYVSETTFLDLEGVTTPEEE